MKAFKIADCVAQFVLIFGSILLNAIYRIDVLGDTFIMSYVLVGSWQIISLITHLFFPAEYKTGLRKYYSILLVITAAIFLIGLISSNLMLNIMLGLLFWSPILALLYFITSLLELRKMNTAMI